MDLQQISSKLLGNTIVAHYPNNEKIIRILSMARSALFPDCFFDLLQTHSLEQQHHSLLSRIHEALSAQIRQALMAATGSMETKSNSDIPGLAEDIADGFILNLKTIQQLLYKDARAGFDGDPAARSVDEVILTYPGFYAIFVHRVAHYLFMQNVPLIPRMMSEHAHSLTGIDIHPGASIGKYFFIDHGTGVVIGETSIIGNHVKLYQGVTIGALSVKKTPGFEEKKRHPTIEDNVIVYSDATILGGDTVIGKGAVIGGNSFIVRSVPPDTVVKAVNPELQYNDGSRRKGQEFMQPATWFYQI